MRAHCKRTGRQGGDTTADGSRAEGRCAVSKVTVPVAPDVTVAVRVTLAPKVEGFGEEARATVLVALFTTWDTAR